MAVVEIVSKKFVTGLDELRCPAAIGERQRFSRLGEWDRTKIGQD
jgi:hypothetical protein